MPDEFPLSTVSFPHLPASTSTPTPLPCLGHDDLPLPFRGSLDPEGGSQPEMGCAGVSVSRLPHHAIADAYDLAGCKLIPNAAEITPVVFVISIEDSSAAQLCRAIVSKPTNLMPAERPRLCGAPAPWFSRASVRASRLTFARGGSLRGRSWLPSPSPDRPGLRGWAQWCHPHGW